MFNQVSHLGRLDQRSDETKLKQISPRECIAAPDSRCRLVERHRLDFVDQLTRCSLVQKGIDYGESVAIEEPCIERIECVQFASAVPHNPSSTFSGDFSGETIAFNGTMNVCSSANCPESTAWGTVSV